MITDDPRHGTQAGAVAHWRSGERPCVPCQTGALRAKKQRQMDEIRRGEPANVPLGELAHTIIATTNRTILANGTGVRSNQLRLYETDGPQRIVRRTTRDKILAFRRPWTPVGIQRRLRALTLLGWSMQVIADRTGIYMTSLAELRRNESIKFVRMEIAEKILPAWDDLCMTAAPDSHSSRETAARASARGWLPGLAWDDIDDPDENPDGWEYVPATRAELLEEFADQQVGVTEVCQRLHLSKDALQKWCSNHALSHVYRALAAREAMSLNQYATTDEQVAS